MWTRVSPPSKIVLMATIKLMAFGSELRWPRDPRYIGYGHPRAEFLNVAAHEGEGERV